MGPLYYESLYLLGVLPSFAQGNLNAFIDTNNKMVRFIIVMIKVNLLVLSLVFEISATTFSEPQHPKKSLTRVMASLIDTHSGHNYRSETPGYCEKCGKATCTCLIM